MEDNELLYLWKTQNDKVEQTLTINKKLLFETINQKAKSSMGSLRRLKTIGIVSFIHYLLILGWLLVYAFSHLPLFPFYFIISLTAIFLINLRGLFDYIKHLILVNNIDYDGSITEIQQRISFLQFSIVNHTKIMVLQLPFWTTLYLNDTWFPGQVGMPYIIFQILLTGSFTYLAYWLYRNQNMENLKKKWYRTLIAGSGGKSVERALAFYKEIESFKSE
ncbi:hypothetical protein ACP6L2_05345 [Sphingobacterium lactis]|uniref:hypothetical protein n=1 Tax=Sphingobacterium lactis TaxID=797291 RepID=UPI003F7D3590